ncbi:uncharacterized protein UV8b_03537 [Ustilaginoidea virens]|uniref:Transcription regulator Rua1 C-terminal domain-containing protein n=1 Tax=Ustilaginoidea virens TaxID=1159556 RepID=A0A8E5MH49_USTVR|nr:uncharacterized protein UV8b_03537 [Ustilaginoidea virens]QUC19296.1 hypothetical protein UV8b_03537 [Ustilaginoidea virens]
MTGDSGWDNSSCGEILDFQCLDREGPIGQTYTADDAIQIIDLRSSNPSQKNGSMELGSAVEPRRMSCSSLAVSTSEPLSDIPSSYDDFPTSISEAQSYASDYFHTSNRNSLMSSLHLSPVVSPRAASQSRPEQVRTRSRGRASPSPRSSTRSTPYSLEGSKNQRWPTGPYAPMQNQGRRCSATMYGNGQEGFGSNQPMSLQNCPPIPSAPAPLYMGSGFQGHPRHQSNVLLGQPIIPRQGMMLASQMPHQGVFEQPSPLPSHGLFKMLQSNGDLHSLHGHFSELSDPPNLLAALQGGEMPPPDEDMSPSDPNLVPYEQDVRFEGDLYTPKWVRGHGNRREGWCGICKPGRWLVLKNSAFWYDKSFTHGISAATGSPFEEPLDTRRMVGNPDVWEGLCGSCNDWIPLVSSKKKGTTWFRHAYKCHTHQKVKDAPKRRRETNSNRAVAGQGSKSKTDVDTRQPSVAPQTVRPASTSASQFHVKVLQQRKHRLQMPPHQESAPGPEGCGQPAS